MIWSVEFTAKAEKQFSKLDSQSKQAIVNYLEKITDEGEPRNFGKPLVGNLSGYWRYRVGRYRIICEIIDSKLVVEVISLGKRESVYN